MSRPVRNNHARCRGDARPARRREHLFRPNYLSFSGTYQCNLTCAHCSVPIEWPDRLPVEAAVRFTEQARAEGVETVAFTGGEPFLYPELLVAVTRRAADMGMRFDKVQTNGVWFRDEAHLEGVLAGLRDAGFSGKLGLSVDKFHGRHTEEAATLCRTARRVFDRDNVISLSYAGATPDDSLGPARDLAAVLGGGLEWSDWLRRYLIVTPELTITLNWNHLAPVERAERLPGAWDGTWFEEDYCEGPGQALIVTPRGDVKPCCGFASDLDELTIGNIHTHSAAEIIQRGRDHPYVGKVFREGLTAIRDEILAADPDALPGETSNHCFFCWHVLAKGIWREARGEAADAGNGRRTALPLAEESFRLRFDGKAVHCDGSAGPGREYAVSASPPVSPPAKMTWGEYQEWVDRAREAGHDFATREA